MREDQIVAAKCRNLLKDHSDTLEYICDEIKKEQAAPIAEDTVEAIALEYKRREGIKEGLILLVQKLNKKADVRD